MPLWKNIKWVSQNSNNNDDDSKTFIQNTAEEG